MDDRPYTAEDFGPTHRWVVFVCADTGHPMKVGYELGEHAEDTCDCGAPLVPVIVAPTLEDEARHQNREAGR